MIRRIFAQLMSRFTIWLNKPYMSEPDTRQYITALPHNYEKADTYKDFVRVFNGNSSPEEGRRVLSQILIWGGVSKGHYRKNIDINELLIKEGGRNLALRILAALTPVQPTDRANQQRRK
jgi:hypothetical protein